MKTSSERIKKDIGIAFLLEFLIGINCWFSEVYVYEEIAYGLSVLLCVPLFFVLKRIVFLSTLSDKKVIDTVMAEKEDTLAELPLQLENENVDLFLDKVVEHSGQYQEKSEIDEWFKLHIKKVKENEKENMDEFYVGSNRETVTEFEKEVGETVENVCGEEIEILFNQHLSNSEANPEKMDDLYIGAKQEVEVQSEQLVAEPVQNLCREEVEVLFSELLTRLDIEPENMNECLADNKLEGMRSEEIAVHLVENICGEEIEVLFEKHVQTEKLNPKCYEQYAYCV